MSNFDDYSYDQSNNDENDYYDDSAGNRDQSFKRSHDNSQDENNHSPAKRPKKEDDVEMRCVVPTNVAGGIIGRKGENIKDMRETFSAQIQLPDGDDFERVLRVRASVESCSEIVLRILPILNDEGGRRGKRGSVGDRNGGAGGKSQSIKLLVHQSQAGGIIGMKGFKIKELRETTGAAIKVHQECTPNSTDRACVISGTPEVVSSCVTKILELLKVTPPKGPVHNYDPAEYYDDDGGYDDYRGGRYGGGGGGGGFGERRGWRDRDDDYDRPRRGGFGMGGGGRGGRWSSRGGRFGSRGGGFRGGRGRY